MCVIVSVYIYFSLADYVGYRDSHASKKYPLSLSDLVRANWADHPYLVCQNWVYVKIQNIY